jgi:hypothetical protein
MAQGSGNFGKVFAIYLACGTIVMFARVLLETRHRSVESDISEKADSATDTILTRLRRFLTIPFVPLTMFLLFGSFFIPQQPWHHMTSTLLYDVVGTVSSAIVTKSLRDIKGDCGSGSVGSNPFGSLHYSPSQDPYYISNLDQPIDEFIASALEGTEFTNVVHIVLESMRADSFPFDEQGPLMDYITKHFKFPRNGTAATTSNITPFIESIAENTIAWETVWATIPFTHKAMIGRMSLRVYLTLDYCGQLALPIDFSVEMEEPAKMYQHCLPQVFRYMNSVTDTQSEILALVNGSESRPRTTDMWETVHIETATGQYDHEKEILQSAGFNTVITAEELGSAKNLGEWPSAMGYYDEQGLDFLWEYVDNVRARVPKNRMYLGWMSTTTHTPFLLSPEWRRKNFRSYVRDKSEWSSTNKWLNAVRWTDDAIKELILGFRERGLEDETLFLMYHPLKPR